MAFLVVEQCVADPQRWAGEFHAGDAARQAAGGRWAVLLADPADEGRVTAIVAFDTAAQAHSWRERPGVEEQLACAGVDLESVRVRVLEEIPPVPANDPRGSVS